MAGLVGEEPRHLQASNLTPVHLSGKGRDKTVRGYGALPRLYRRLTRRPTSSMSSIGPERASGAPYLGLILTQ